MTNSKYFFLKKAALLAVLCFLLSSILGCEAFIRKFSRKPKKSEKAPEMVLQPEEYTGPQMTKEELYRQHFLYWKVWQEELVSALSFQATRKRKLDCAQQALKYLANMRSMLAPEYQKRLDVYISRLQDLSSEIDSDVYGRDSGRQAQTAEHIKMSILQNFSYASIKDYMS